MRRSLSEINMLIPRVVPSASTSYTLESSGSRDRAPEPSTLPRHEPRIGALLSWHHILVAILNKLSRSVRPMSKALFHGRLIERLISLITSNLQLYRYGLTRDYLTLRWKRSFDFRYRINLFFKIVYRIFNIIPCFKT